MTVGGCFLRSLVLAPALLVLTGCIGDGRGFSIDPACSNHIRDPDFENDVNNCGGCDKVCDLLGAVSDCAAGACVIDRCEPGFFDLDGDDENGCECRGQTADDCTVCLPYEVALDQIDNDCDSTTDEEPPGVEQISPVPVNRVHCGAVGASCLLSPTAADVECHAVVCSESRARAGYCGACTELDGRWHCGVCEPVGLGTKPYEEPFECFDGLDNDGSGVVDDGPACEVLLANAATVECDRADPSEKCPPNHIRVPVNQGPLASIEVAMTYDFLLDRYEVTRRQYAAYLHDQGFCDDDVLGRPPACDVPAWEATLPYVAIWWNEAADYCTWAGKRLPTLAEWYRAASADQYRPGGARDAQVEGLEPDCDMSPAPVTVRCGADRPVPVEEGGGEAFIGNLGRADAWLVATAIHHLTGNVAEPVIDSPVDWCEAARAGDEPLLRCPAPGERGVVWQKAPLRDGHFTKVGGLNKIYLGGSYRGPIDDDRYELQSMGGNGGGIGGIRCARTVPRGEVLHPIDAWWRGGPIELP